MNTNLIQLFEVSEGIYTLAFLQGDALRLLARRPEGLVTMNKPSAEKLLAAFTTLRSLADVGNLEIGTWVLPLSKANSNNSDDTQWVTDVFDPQGVAKVSTQVTKASKVVHETSKVPSVMTPEESLRRLEIIRQNAACNNYQRIKP